MAPATTFPTGRLDWGVAKKVCSPQDIERLACAFLNTEDIYKFNWESAASQFGTGVKGDSFKRSIWVIAKKVKEASAAAGAAEGNTTNGNTADGVKKPSPAAANGKAKGDRKRKAATAAGYEDDSGAETPGSAKKAKEGKNAGDATSSEINAKDGGWTAINRAAAGGELKVKKEDMECGWEF